MTRSKTLALALALAACTAGTAAANNVGNVIFLHPDGTGLNHWTAARMYWKGPDGSLNWDRLPQMAAYRGHMTELLTGTSNGGATVHAFGYKVEGLGSFGKDGNGNLVPPTDRFINALSGYPGSILREAAANGYPTGLVNDGNIGEPGTGVFAAEVGNRDNWNAIALQIIAGRDGAGPAASSDVPPAVILGGGERNFLPQGTPRCSASDAGTFVQQGIRTYPLNCMVHTLDWSKPSGTGGTLGIGRDATPDRTDGRNLIAEAASAGFIVIRTRAEFAQVQARLQSDPSWRPRILGLFAAHHIYNDRNEEDLIANGFRNMMVPVDAKTSNLVLFGNPRSDNPGWNPPLADELMRVAVTVLTRHSNHVNKPYYLVAEPESNDNFGNNNNAIGMLVAMKVADDMIGVAMDAMNARERGVRSEFSTVIVTAADSDASGMQVLSIPADSPAVAAVGSVGTNGAAGQASVNNPADGLYGRGTVAFTAEPDQFGNRLRFGIVWAGGPDFAGGILSRATGNRAENRDTRRNLTLSDFSERFDSTDVYRFMYFHLFGRLLPRSVTEAPTR